MPSPNDATTSLSALQSAILTSANLALVATDVDGVIRLFNAGAQRMLGYSEADVLHQSQPSIFFDPLEEIRRAAEISLELEALIAPGFESLTAKASRGTPDMFDMTCICKDGRRLPAKVLSDSLYDSGGKKIGYLLHFSDASASQHMESARKEAIHTAETASEAKTEFLSRMSHELRTPLNAILGFAQLLESGKPKVSAAQQKSLEQIMKAGWFLLSLINEVLDLTLVESGQLVLSNEPISVSEILAECESMMAPQAAMRGIRMRFSGQTHGHHVFADRTRLKQVLINLLMNGIKYNRPGGMLSVELTPRPEKKLRIQVRDSGVGMSPAQIGQLFQPFNRLGKEASGEEGTGIGLVVAKRLMENMGGQIGVESTPDVGSEFWIELELTSPEKLGAQELDADTVPQTPEGSCGSDYTVLYVEDNPANLALVEQILERRGHVRFMSAANASIGIAFTRTHLPDVVLMDLHMPGLSGMDAMKILSSDPRTAHIPIIALSASVLPHEIRHAIRAGFVDYVTKPIKVGTFMRSLDKALARSGRVTQDFLQ